MSRREMASEPSMEEILQSIRRIIAEEPAAKSAAGARRPPPPLPRATPAPSQTAAEFGAPVPVAEASPLIGRLANALPPQPVAELEDDLSDLIESDAPSVPPVAQAEPARLPDLGLLRPGDLPPLPLTTKVVPSLPAIEDPTGAAAAASALGALAAGLAAARPVAASLPAPKVSSDRAAEPVAPEPPALPAAQTGAAADVTATERPALPVPPPVARTESIVPAEAAPVAVVAKEIAKPGAAPIAAVAATVAADAVKAEMQPAAAPAGATLEDTVAHLLRPMLRQWLDTNMPRIVEKALRSELDDTKKS